MNRKAKRQRETLPVLQRISTYIFLLPVVFALGLGSGYLLWGGAADAADITQPETTRQEVSADDDPSLGPEDAPITIIEFSDYQCPYCARWHIEVFERLMTSYPGQIRFVYRDYPLPGHTEASPAAEAANCAGEQDAYWEFHNAIFSGKYSLGYGAYQQYATELGLDVDEFIQCFYDQRFRAEVLADLQDAQNLGVQATPTFFINGIMVEGALPYEEFAKIVNQELAETNP